MKNINLVLLVIFTASCGKGKNGPDSITPAHRVRYLTVSASPDTDITFYDYVNQKDSNLLHRSGNFSFDFTVPGNVDLKTLGLYVSVVNRDSVKWLNSAYILVDDSSQGQVEVGDNWASSHLR